MERQAARYRTEAQVRDELVRRAAVKAQLRALQALPARLRSEAQVRIDEAALERIVVE